MSPNLSSVGKYERKYRVIIHRLWLGPLQMKIHSVISEIVKHELQHVARIWNVIDCWRRSFSVAVIKTVLSKLVLLKMCSKCGWNLQFREIWGSRRGDFDSHCCLGYNAVSFMWCHIPEDSNKPPIRRCSECDYLMLKNPFAG
jgi:hypothetical protein